MSELSIRPAQASESDVRAIYDLLLNMFDEGRLCRLDPIKALHEIYRVCLEEAAWMIHDGDQLVATLGLAEGKYWFSEEPCLITRWIYARPAYRGVGGAWEMLLEEVFALVKLADMRAFVDAFNPSKASKRLNLAFSKFSMFPQGITLQAEPGQEKR